MNCQEVQAVLPGLPICDVDHAVLAHLKTCSACSSEWDRLTAADFQLRELLLDEKLDTSLLDRRIRQHLAPLSPKWLGIAAGVLLISGLLTYSVFESPDRACRDAASDHHREVIDKQPRTWQTGATAINALAARQGIEASAISKLTAAGLHLERARICRLDGRLFLHLVYSDGGRQLSLFLRHDVTAPQDIRIAESGTEYLAYLQSHGIRAIIVTDQSRESARKLARLL